MKSLQDIIEELNANSAELVKEKDGVKIYSPSFGDNATVGNPMFIICDNGNCRLTDIDESFKILEYLDK